MAWASTHAKRYAGDKWCKERGMIYRFIENSRGALFAENQSMERMAENLKLNNKKPKGRQSSW